MKIRQNWLIWRILWVKKKRRHFLEYFRRWKYRKKKKCPIFVTLTLTPWTFFSFYPFFLLFMGSRVKACYFLDFQNFLQKKVKKGVLWPFWSFGGFCESLTKSAKCPKWPQYPFLPLFCKNLFWKSKKITWFYSTPHK